MSFLACDRRTVQMTESCLNAASVRSSAVVADAFAWWRDHWESPHCWWHECLWCQIHGTRCSRTRSAEVESDTAFRDPPCQMISLYGWTRKEKKRERMNFNFFSVSCSLVAPEHFFSSSFSFLHSLPPHTTIVSLSGRERVKWALEKKKCLTTKTQHNRDTFFVSCAPKIDSITNRLKRFNRFSACFQTSIFLHTKLAEVGEMLTICKSDCALLWIDGEETSLIADISFRYEADLAAHFWHRSHCDEISNFFAAFCFFPRNIHTFLLPIKENGQKNEAWKLRSKIPDAKDFHHFSALNSRFLSGTLTFSAN